MAGTPGRQPVSAQARDTILGRIRTNLKKGPGLTGPPPAVRIAPPRVAPEAYVASFKERLEALAGRVHHVAQPEEALAIVQGIIGDKSTVASNAPILARCGITRLGNVQSGFTDAASLKEASAQAEYGITSADFALAETGTLVMLSSHEEARMASLVPVRHIAVVETARLLSGLDELLGRLERPNDQTASMVLITGPSRSADIEQILVRGVHGPGEVTVIFVGP
ncbi:MAG: lactate utilization protein [Acidobacteria bacterium]|nr:lactate utilization protein [Acidobacteriota bacterium]